MSFFVHLFTHEEGQITPVTPVSFFFLQFPNNKAGHTSEFN